MFHSFFLKNTLAGLNFPFTRFFHKNKKNKSNGYNFKFSNINHFLETKVFLFFIIFFCLAFQALSYFTLWTDTELYPTHSSQYLFSQYANEFLFSLKPLFYSILKLSFSFSNWLDWLPMTSARTLFAFNGLAILALMYFYIKNKTSRYNAILAVLFLAGMNIFLDRAFRVRSDLLTASFSLICLLVNLNIKEQRENWKFYIVLPLLAILLLISPKGIYFICFSSILLWQDLKIKFQAKLVLKIFFFICFAFYLLSLLFKDPFFITAIYESAGFYLFNLSETYHFILKHSWLKNLTELSHIGLFLARNPFLVLIISLKLLFIIYSLFLSKNRKKDLSDLYFLILCFVVLFHPQQKLFFLSALSPFFCIAFFTDKKWLSILNNYSHSFKAFLLASTFIYTFSHSSYFSHKIYTKKNNLEQKNVIKKLNNFYKDTDLSVNIFDPNCIVYTKKTHCKYILYNKSLGSNFNSFLENNSFDIILSSFAVSDYDLLAYEKAPFKFVNIKNHIYYKAFIIEQSPNFKEINKNTPFDKKNSVSKPNQKAEHLTLKNRTENLSQTQQTLSGEKILKNFEQTKQITSSKQDRKYFYLYIDRLNRPLNKNIECKNKDSIWLKEGCYYSEEQFKKSLIALRDKKIALFYIPFPFHIQSEKSLRLLLRYDRF